MKLNKASLFLFSIFNSLLFCFPGAYANTPFQDLFKNKTILVLGGTGYLGKAIIEGVQKYSPKNIFVLSRDEVKHFNFSKTFGSNTNIKNIVGDIRDYECLLRNTQNVDIVFHVAALKRMDTLESNVSESIKTNILGSLNVFNACARNNVKRVIFISTDKACSPINIYGASKFVSEKIFTNYDYSRINTAFTVVRFGNIIDSTGSVIPIFSEKINSGQIIPLTDSQMTRFIITKNEAFELICKAIKYSVGGEIFIKKIPAMKIIDLIEVLKKKYNADNQVKITGLRPGEKIHETLINESEILRTFEFEQMFTIVPNLNEWSLNLEKNNKIPEYIKNGVLAYKKMNNYSSDNFTVSQEILADYLNDFWFNFRKLK